MTVSSDLIIGPSAQKTVTTAGTREPLATGKSEQMRVHAVAIKALTTNTGKVYVGDETVSSTAGIDLDPGQPIVFRLDAHERRLGLRINLTKIWLDVDTDGEGVSYTVVRD